MPKHSETSLGKMEGLKSYEPEKGWSDIPESAKKDKDHDEKFPDDSNLESWKIEQKNNDVTTLHQNQSDTDEFFEEDFIEDIQESKMSNLARQVAETNTLVDKALGSISTESHESGGSKTLDELGESLSELFGQLYEGSEVGNNSPWNKISESLGNLSSEIDRRDSLRNELKETQHRIDNVRLNLIEEIQNVANSEQERLSMIRMRSRLATVMADKLLNKLR